MFVFLLVRRLALRKATSSCIGPLPFTFGLSGKHIDFSLFKEHRVLKQMHWYVVDNRFALQLSRTTEAVLSPCTYRILHVASSHSHNLLPPSRFLVSRIFHCTDRPRGCRPGERNACSRSERAAGARKRSYQGRRAAPGRYPLGFAWHMHCLRLDWVVERVTHTGRQACQAS